MKSLWFGLVLLLIAVSASQVWAKEEMLSPHITVIGEGEVKTVPDQVVVNFGVQTFDKSLSAAQLQNDERVKALLVLVNAQKIDPKDVQTSYIQIYPDYAGNHRTELIGYTVDKTIIVTLKDLTKFEPLLTGALNAGVNRVNGINFQTSELHKFRDQARAMAISAAQEKATALAGQLGQRIGQPYSIDECCGSAGLGQSRSFGAQQFSMAAGDYAYDAGGGSFSPGQISVTAQVTVTFELIGASPSQQ